MVRISEEARASKSRLVSHLVKEAKAQEAKTEGDFRAQQVVIAALLRCGGMTNEFDV